MPQLLHHHYGKHRVRVSKIQRDPSTPPSGPEARHDFVEAEVDVELEGGFEQAYTDGDNTPVVATDTVRNTVYALAMDDPWGSIETLGLTIARHFVGTYDHVSRATVRLREHRWHRIGDHPHAFTGSDGETPTTTVSVQRDGHASVTAGLDHLMIAKTTQTGFENFHRDAFRSLPDTDDRILATVLKAQWAFDATDHNASQFNTDRAAIRTAMLNAFGDHYSVSVQQTLYRMGAAALEACPRISQITLTMPNKHHLRFDLEKIGRPNANVVFHVTDEPCGFIEATVGR